MGKAVKVWFGDRYIERPFKELLIEALLTPVFVLLAWLQGWI